MAGSVAALSKPTPQSPSSTLHGPTGFRPPAAQGWCSDASRTAIYPCSHGMHRNLAEMYTADPRFEAYFEKRGKGLAVFVQDAIRANEARSRNRRDASAPRV